MKIRSLSLSAGLLMAALSACTATGTLNVPNPSASSSASPSPAPSASASTTPSAAPSESPNTTEPTPMPSAGDGKLVVMGADLFNDVKINYHAGQKWVYKMTLKGLAISLPAGLPAGIQIPGSTGDTDLGEMTWEVLSVEGSMVTMRTHLDLKVGAGSVPDTTRTFDKDDKSALAKLYVESQNSGTEGTATYTSGGSESVTVAAGTYAATRVNGVFKITTLSNGVRGDLDQTAKIWLTSSIGLVKEEVISKISASGSASDTTTVIELKSFTG